MAAASISAAFSRSLILAFAHRKLATYLTAGGITVTSIAAMMPPPTSMGLSPTCTRPSRSSSSSSSSAHGCHHTTKDDQTKLDRLMKGLDAFLERDHDRAVFDFKTRHKPPTSNASGQS